MSRSCRRAVIAAFVLGLGLVPGVANAASSSLYSGPGPRPGPDILYSAPATAPQLTNAGVWKASPILVSGAGAYRNGEYLYQDFLYDDHGGRQAADPADPRSTADTFSKPNGTYSYPTDPAYAHNAADFVELRVRPLASATAFRVTLNTLKDPSLVAFSIALGGTAGTTHPFPAGANVSAPADLFLTVHRSGSGMVGDLVNAVTGASVASTPVTIDTTRRQIEVRVPHSAWDPTGKVVRLAAGAGLWDKANNRYLLPQPASDAPQAGGSGTAVSPPARQPPRRLGGEVGAGGLRLPLQRADAAGRRRRRDRAERGVVARQGPGRRAARGRHQRAARGRRLPQARVEHERRERRAAIRPDGPHPREPLRDRAGSRLLRELLQRRPQHVPRRVPGAPAALRDLRPAQARACPGLRHDVAAALARGHLQPVPGEPQPVAVRRARLGIDRDHASQPRPGRLL